jgi:outer membrane protein insertion porin family
VRRIVLVVAGIALACGCGGSHGGRVAKPGTADVLCGGAGEDERPPVDRAAGDLAELEGRRIVGVELLGAPSLGERLREEIVLAVGAPLDRGAIGDQLRRLWSVGLIDDASARAIPDGDGVRVELIVHERAVVAGLDLDVRGALAPGKLRRLRALAGALDDPARAQRTARRLEDELRTEGHWRARVVAVDRRTAGGDVRLCVGVEAGPRYRIASIRFPGARAVGERRLRALIAQQNATINAVGGAYRADLLDLDLLRIQAEYWDAGRVMVKVGAPVATVDEDRAAIELSIPVDEGKQFSIGSVGFTGVPPALVPSYRSLLGVREGAVFGRSELAAGLDRIRDAEVQAGRAGNVQPVTSIDLEAARIDLMLEVTP